MGHTRCPLLRASLSTDGHASKKHSPQKQRPRWLNLKMAVMEKLPSRKMTKMTQLFSWSIITAATKPEPLCVQNDSGENTMATFSH